jgi:hypothetical protein
MPKNRKIVYSEGKAKPLRSAPVSQISRDCFLNHILDGRCVTYFTQYDAAMIIVTTLLQRCYKFDSGPESF